MKCSKCGFENVEGQKFCPNCGNDLTTSQEENNATETEKVSDNTSNPVLENKPVEVNSQIEENNSVEVSNNKKEGKKCNKKLFIIIGGVVLVAAIIAVLFLVFGKSDKEKALKKMFDLEAPIKIEKHEKYGFINSKGKEIVKADYDVASNYFGNYAYVIKDKEADDIKVEFIDRKGKVKLSYETDTYSTPVYLELYNVWYFDDKLYDDNLNLLFNAANVDYLGYGYFLYNLLDSNKSGIINYKKDEILTKGTGNLDAKLSDNDFDDEDLYILLDESNKKFEVYSLKSKKVVKSFDSALHVYVNDNNIFYSVDKDYKYHYYFFKNGKVLYESDNSFTCVDFKNNILGLSSGVYYDAKNKKEIYHVDYYQESETNSIFYNKYGYKIYKEDNLGVKNSNDKVLVKNEYKSFGFISTDLYEYLSSENGKDYIIGKKDGSIDLIDLKSGNIIEKFNGAVSVENKGIFLVVYFGDSNRYKKSVALYNLITNKKSNEFSNYSDIDVFFHYYVENDDENLVYKYYDSNFKNIYTFDDNTRTTIPSVSGKKLDEVKQILKDKGLVVGEVIEQYREYYDEGNVFKIEPSSGIVDKGTEIKIYVSLGKTSITLENYVGRDYNEVKEILESKGITVYTWSRYNYPEGTKKNAIVEQSKPEGTVLETGDSIYLYYAY